MLGFLATDKSSLTRLVRCSAMVRFAVLMIGANFWTTYYGVRIRYERIRMCFESNLLVVKKSASFAILDFGAALLELREEYDVDLVLRLL